VLFVRIWPVGFAMLRILRAARDAAYALERRGWPQVKAEFEKVLALRKSDSARGLVQLGS